MTSSEAFSLKGERAVITGGGSGLGLAIAESMVACGADVVLLGRNEEQLKDACSRLGEAHAHWYQYDVTEFDKAEEMIQGITSLQGPITILCNNAGKHCKKTVEEMTMEDFQEVLDVHVLGSIALTKAVLPQMEEAGKGSILFTASMASFIGIPLTLGYSASKSAFLGIVRALATEVSPKGIRVNAIAPGWIETPLFRQMVDNDLPRQEKILNRTPAGRFGRPEEIGWVCAFLCSPAAGFITGTCLPVDGGALIGF